MTKSCQKRWGELMNSKSGKMMMMKEHHITMMEKMKRKSRNDERYDV
jgi:hypothetical protein